MGDYDLEILEQYPIQVANVRKARGAFLCETDRGLMLLKQAALSKPRMLVMNEIHKAMKKQEHLRCDELIPNREGEFHNREMKKVWSFIRKKPIKGEFESRFLECFEDMYRVAAAVEERLGNSSYRRLQKEAKERGSFIHGEYNYHNILITPEGMTAVNFEHVGRDLQAADLAYFLRKVMEKHQWNEKLGAEILRAYCAVNPLSEEEKEYIALRLSYPEKFWKCANTYYNSNKAWISSKSVEKLRISIEQNEIRKRFLEQIFAFHLEKSGV